MSPITERDFQSELPLNPAAFELLSTFFEQGWPDPSKLHHQSSHLRNLIHTALESIAGNLGVAKNELEIVGELGFGFQIAISGLLEGSRQSFTFAAIDRQIVHAFARQHAARGMKVSELTAETSGLVDYQRSNSESILSWQSTNRETGVIQNLPASNSYSSLFADMTASYEINRLPENWDSAVWDPRSFGGPQGIAIVGISNNGSWRNPGPQLDNRRVFGSYSKPLLLATAIALEQWVKTAAENHAKLKKLNEISRQLLTQRIPELKIAGELRNSDPRYLAFCIPGLVSEELLRKVESAGFLIDAGSACGGGALAPSHVLTAMGFPLDGNFRLTFKPEHSVESVNDLVERIAASA